MTRIQGAKLSREERLLILLGVLLILAMATTIVALRAPPTDLGALFQVLLIALRGLLL
jgi:hypothetical protein